VSSFVLKLINLNSKVMKGTTILLIALLCFSISAMSQVAINTDGSNPDNSAMLDVKSSDKGLLIPRLTTTSRTALESTATGGLMVYDTDLDKFFIFEGTSWHEVSAGNVWTHDTGKTYLSNNSDDVGVGTSSPKRKLQIVGSDTLGSVLISPNISSLYSNKNSELLFGEDRDYYSGMSIFYNGSDNKMYYYGKSGFNDYGPLLTINRNGSGIGINTDTPLKNFHVNGGNSLVSLLLTPSSLASGKDSEILFAEEKNYNYGMSIIYDGGDNRMYFLGKNGTNTYGPNLTIEREGNVGIGTDNPTELFEVVSTGDNRTAYFLGEGRGESDATIFSKNQSTLGGLACYFESNGEQTTVITRQNGTGAITKFLGPGDDNEEIKIINDGTIELFNANHYRTISIAPAENNVADAGQITLYSANGATATIEIDGSYNSKGRITTNELQITGGSDLSEFFNLSDYEAIEKGMVVSIDENNPGHLKICHTAYDKKVAGIVSGANNIDPGLIMSQKGTIADGEHLIALSGRVYCKTDATKSPVEIGDMLTTSDIPGFAMKATDKEKASGAIIGKAMTSLKSGKGLVLVLVSLQ
jgi:hypothetical protein